MVDEGLDWFEAVAVDGAGSKLGDGLNVGGIVVAEVVLEPVPWVGEGEFGHESIAGDFGNDSGSGDGGVFGISFDERFDRAWRIRGETVAIDEGFLWIRGEFAQGLAHSLKGGIEDIEAVDFVGVNDDRGGVGKGDDAKEGLIPLFFGELLGVVNAFGVESIWK